MKYVNGDEYTGQWLHGKKQGKGVYNYSDGDYYDGEWVKD
jgi:radial spoke head protein 1